MRSVDLCFRLRPSLTLQGSLHSTGLPLKVSHNMHDVESGRAPLCPHFAVVDKQRGDTETDIETGGIKHSSPPRRHIGQSLHPADRAKLHRQYAPKYTEHGASNYVRRAVIARVDSRQRCRHGEGIRHSARTAIHQEYDCRQRERHRSMVAWEGGPMAEPSGGKGEGYPKIQRGIKIRPLMC